MPDIVVKHQDMRRPNRRDPRPIAFPIFRLPPELLAHIFVLGSEDDHTLPLSVSHTCSTWRRLALWTPSLWRQICLDPRGDMWRQRIYRAKDCSLDIKLLPYVQKLGGIFQPQRLDHHTVQWHMHLVTPFIHRWRSLEIQFLDYAPFLWNSALSECCSTGPDARAPCLQDLSLVYRDNDDPKEFLLFSGFAPRLRRVTLDGVCLSWRPSLFANLTCLDYAHHGFTRGGQAVHDVVAMLRVSSRLIELRITFPRSKISHRYDLVLPMMEPVPTTRTVVLRHLRTLHLRVDTRDIPPELVRLMSHVHSPNLISLHLVDLGHRPRPFRSLGLFTGSYVFPPSLRVVEVGYGWNYEGMMTSMLARLPNIRKWKIEQSHTKDQRFVIHRHHGAERSWVAPGDSAKMIHHRRKTRGTEYI